MAKEAGINVRFVESEEIPDHPNTARILISDESGKLEIVGISIGGGKTEIIELNGFELKLSGNSPTLLVLHKDQFGAVADVATILAKHEINIGYMQVARKEKGLEALMSIETDQPVSDELLQEIRLKSGMYSVTVLNN
jgi:L-serine dehydratase